MSGVPQGVVLDLLLFILFMAKMMRKTENIFISYADDSIFVAVCKRPADMARVTKMLLNPSKTKSILFSRNHAPYPLKLDLRVNDCVVELVDEVSILGVCLDSKLSFEYHLRKIAVAASQKLFILRHAWHVFNDQDMKFLDSSMFSQFCPSSAVVLLPCLRVVS